jgi:hypothetical protein
MHDGLLFIHIVGAAGWLGGGLFGWFSTAGIARIGAPTAGETMKSMEKWAGVYFGVSSGLVLLSGIGLVLTSDAYGWGDTFVLIGLGAFVVSSILQSTIGRKANTRLVEAGTSGTDVEPALRAWRQASSWDLLVLFVVVWAMVTKLGA